MVTYLVFAYDKYYPNGGYDDLVGVFASESEARACDVCMGNSGYIEIVKVSDGLVAEKVGYRVDGRWQVAVDVVLVRVMHEEWGCVSNRLVEVGGGGEKEVADELLTSASNNRGLKRDTLKVAISEPYTVWKDDDR